MPMLNQEIYEGALRLIGESLEEGENEDYKDRASYLIAAFCCETEELEASVRRRLGLGSRPSFNPVWVSLDDEFPSLDRLAVAACLYVAAMLILDDDPERSDKLYDRYCDSLASLETAYQGALEPEPDLEPDDEPEIFEMATLESIRDNYFFD